MFDDEVIDGEFAFFGQQQDAGGCELFGERADFEDGFGAHGNLEFHIRETVVRCFDYLAGLDDT